MTIVQGLVVRLREKKYPKRNEIKIPTWYHDPLRGRKKKENQTREEDGFETRRLELIIAMTKQEGMVHATPHHGRTQKPEI